MGKKKKSKARHKKSQNEAADVSPPQGSKAPDQLGHTEHSWRWASAGIGFLLFGAPIMFWQYDGNLVAWSFGYASFVASVIAFFVATRPWLRNHGVRSPATAQGAAGLLGSIGIAVWFPLHPETRAQIYVADGYTIGSYVRQCALLTTTLVNRGPRTALRNWQAAILANGGAYEVEVMYERDTLLFGDLDGEMERYAPREQIAERAINGIDENGFLTGWMRLCRPEGTPSPSFFTRDGRMMSLLLTYRDALGNRYMDTLTHTNSAFTPAETPGINVIRSRTDTATLQRSGRDEP